MKIAILLSTYNGEKYLQEQLDSLLNQSYDAIEVIVRDDGSRDKTYQILEMYDITLLENRENLGVKGSFEVLLAYTLEHSDAQYFMFCDQDDVWKNDKIEQTLSKMQAMEQEHEEMPLLVHSDLEVVNESLETIADSMWEYEAIFPQYNTFNRLLIQNTITGCTMMINRRLAEFSLPIPSGAVMHDWWMGLVAAQFGKVGYIDQSTIKYRQHSNNTIGAKDHKKINLFRHYAGVLFSLIKRDQKYMKDLEINIKQAKAFLDTFESQLNQETINMLKSFIHIEQSSFLQKRQTIYRYKLYKQSFINNIALWIKL
ncbi:MAG: glycosyltransferase family 2 protein [Campylobacterota bacterium]|nr:glycosyltransferase family 2 protein [Campylobacterota bacterium]